MNVTGYLLYDICLAAVVTTFCIAVSSFLLSLAFSNILYTMSEDLKGYYEREAFKVYRELSRKKHDLEEAEKKKEEA